VSVTVGVAKCLDGVTLLQDVVDVVEPVEKKLSLLLVDGESVPGAVDGPDAALGECDRGPRRFGCIDVQLVDEVGLLIRCQSEDLQD
jgi:hypothetical protein